MRGRGNTQVEIEKEIPDHWNPQMVLEVHKIILRSTRKAHNFFSTFLEPAMSPVN